MRRRGSPSASAPILIGCLLAVLAGCGAAATSYEDEQIVAALKLERAPEQGEGYLLGDPFCVVSERLFNDSAEVEAATADEDAGVVVASRAGNVAVEGIPAFFGPECRERARQRLDKLDPAARE